MAPQERCPGARRYLPRHVFVTLAVTSIALGASGGGGIATTTSPVHRHLQPQGWFAGLNVFGSMSYRDIAAPMGMTATIWNAGAYLPSETETVKGEVARAHAQGWRHVAGLSAMMIPARVLAARSDLVEARRLTIDGETPLATWVEPSPLTADSNHPLWRTFLKEVIHRNIDCGTDGILIDDALGTFVWDRAVFSPPTLAAIRDYLRSHYSAGELAARFDIPDIDSFDLARYLRDHGLLETWLSEPWQLSLYSDLVVCLLEQSRAFIDDLVLDGRQYGRSRYAREIAFTANISDLNPALLPSSNRLDFFMIEYHHDFHGGFPPSGRETVMLSLARALKPTPPQWILGTNTAARMMQMPSTETLIQMMIGGTYAAGGGFFVPPAYAWSPETGPGEYTADPAAMLPYYRHVVDNRFLYDAVHTHAEVAVMYSLSSALLRWGAFLDSFYGASLALLDGHVPYDTVVAGRPGLLDRQTSTAELAKYGTLVLPNVSCMTDQEIAVVLAYCSAGGTVVAWGDVGGADQNARASVRPELVALLTPGSHACGAGVFLYTPEDLGWAYMHERSALAHERILQLLPSGLPSTAPASVNAFTWSNESVPLALVHLLNYAYDLPTDTLTSTPAFSWSMRPPDGLDPGQAQAYFLSPETAPQLLPYNLQDGLLTLPVPPLHVCGTLAALPRQFAEEQAAAVLAPVFRRLGEVRRRGATTGEIESLAAAIAAASATENHLLARDLGRQLDALLAPSLRPRILFDEAHQERNTMLLERAQRLAPSLTDNHPYWIYFGRYRDAVANQLVIDVNEGAELTNELLARYDVLFLADPLAHSLDGHPLTSAEITAIWGFVGSGGGLLVLGDAGVSSDVNRLTSPFGIELDGRAIYSHHPSGGPGDFPVSGLKPSALTNRYDEYVMNWGASLRLGPRATALAETGADTWQDQDGNAEQDASEPSGPFAVLAVSKSDRVVCLADNNFHHDPEWGGAGSVNAPVLTRILTWLAAGRTAP
jgi:hypothetical protein